MIVFVCALSCEARPLIEHYSLKLESNEAPFKIYSRDNVFLILCGVGKIAAAAACGYFFAKYPRKDSVWLNVGAVGAQFRTGTPFLAHKITDLSRAHLFFPNFTFHLPCRGADLITVDKPLDTLLYNSLYDMEGVGFYDTVQRFVPLEQVHIFKVVSDQGNSTPTKEEITHLITEKIPMIEEIVEMLQEVALLGTSIDDSSLSATEKVQFKRLLEKCKALGLDPPSKDIQELEKFLETHVPAHIR